MFPELNINLINHKNKDVKNYGAGDIKMYNIYQLTTDFHPSKEWCKSQGSSSVIHVKQSSTVASFSPSKYLLHTQLQTGASTKGPLVSPVSTDSVSTYTKHLSF
jgi:hypothetical protein